MKQTENLIVVGIDDSPSAAAALAWAAGHAREVGATLKAVHVLGWPPADNPFAYEVMADTIYRGPSTLEASYREPSQDVFDACEPEPGWTLTFAHGHAGRILVQESEGTRLLVVGCREHTGVGRMLSGSASHYCLNHATCPVVAVPVDADADAGPDLRPPTRTAEPVPVAL